MLWDYWHKYPGRFLGLALGLLFGLLAVLLGFWAALFIFICAGVGYGLAWWFEQYGGFGRWLEEFWRRR